MAQNSDWGEDIMDIDRDHSPVTVRDDPSPYLNAPYERRSQQAEVIDLDSLDEHFSLNGGGYLTDKDFAKIFRQSNQAGHQSNTGQGFQAQPPRLKNVDSLLINAKRYEKGRTIELEDGDFLRILNILQNTRSKEYLLRGRRLRRTSRFRGLFDQHLNEVVMLVEQMEPIPPKDRRSDLENVPLANVVRFRDMILTNEAYPAYSFREDGGNRELPRVIARESCRLVCRWKIILTYRMKSTHKACVEMSIVRLEMNDSDRGYRAKDSDLRREWRGTTTKRGSCAAWLPGEERFDMNEQMRYRGIDILGYHHGSLNRERQDIIDLTGNTSQQPRRYTFGDAFCGAGGASRAAKSTGFRVDWAVDFDPAPIESYKQNFFNTRCEAAPVHVFVTYMDENFVVDVLHLSPPCKTFSPIHTRAGKDDDMNSASFFAVGEILKKTKPRIMIMENTFGLVERWRDWLYSMVQVVTSLGFSVRWKVFNLAEYGLPQARRRLIVFTSCPGEILPEFPEPTHGPGRKRFTTINDAIESIPRGVPDHNVAGAPRRNAQPYDGNLPLRNCITTAGSLDYHPSGKRTFTDRELACLQGFPLEHVFGANKKKMQIGNSFPPLVAKVFFSCILRQLEETDRRIG